MEKEKNLVIAEGIVEKIEKSRKTMANYNEIKNLALMLLAKNPDVEAIRDFIESEVDLSMWYDVLNIDKVKKFVDSYTDESVSAEFSETEYITEFLANEIFKNKEAICNAICDAIG